MDSLYNYTQSRNNRYHTLSNEPRRGGYEMGCLSFNLDYLNYIRQRDKIDQKNQFYQEKVYDVQVQILDKRLKALEERSARMERMNSFFINYFSQPSNKKYFNDVIKSLTGKGEKKTINEIDQQRKYNTEKKRKVNLIQRDISKMLAEKTSSDKKGMISLIQSLRGLKDEVQNKVKNCEANDRSQLNRIRKDFALQLYK